MLEALLVGLLRGSIYYLADRHKNYLDEKNALKALSWQEIHDNLESGLKSLFPKLSQSLSPRDGLKPEQIESLGALFFDQDGELEPELRDHITNAL
jgi:hypothetical protein